MYIINEVFVCIYLTNIHFIYIYCTNVCLFVQWIGECMYIGIGSHLNLFRIHVVKPNNIKKNFCKQHYLAKGRTKKKLYTNGGISHEVT